jgi:hypothetical protein
MGEKRIVISYLNGRRAIIGTLTLGPEDIVEPRFGPIDLGGYVGSVEHVGTHKRYVEYREVV